jgi:hypothetical protein
MPERLSNVPLSQLVPETQDWNNGRGIDLLSWIGCVGSFEQAIAYGELFWPDFVEFENCVFFAGFSEESYQGFVAQANGDRQAVEAVMNHRHLIDFFSGMEREPSEHQLVYLGRLLREIWETKLHRDFPARQFVVSFPEENIEYLQDYEITFYQGGKC